MDREVAWNHYTDEDLTALEALASRYIHFISDNKTERECTKAALDQAKELGYESLEDLVKKGQSLKAGDKIFATAQGKALILIHVGTDPMEQGLAILGAHIDSPRLDLKPNPLYETSGFALCDTHYYGGIKNYQWVSMPLAIHGVVATTDGGLQEIVIGENADEPVFCITDLLPHLGREQLKKEGSHVIEGEDLDLLVGNRPLKGDQDKDADNKDEKDKPKEAVKAFTLQLLKDHYGIEEEDFLSAELEIVPAGRAREAGLDRSMIIGYGQDDRVCAYTSLEAQLALAQDPQPPRKTAVTLLVDKEEIGSVGATGMASRFFENVMAEVMALAGEDSPLALRRALSHSSMLSSDVSAGFDPSYASVYETKNASYLGRGLVFNKYTGSRGKSGSNDASAEYIASLRRIMDDASVFYQTAELGKVDAGGGGTIAYIPAEYGMDVIDSGVSVLSMHAPWEVTSKADVYEAFKGYKAFLKGI